MIILPKPDDDIKKKLAELTAAEEDKRMMAVMFSEFAAMEEWKDVEARLDAMEKERANGQSFPGMTELSDKTGPDKLRKGLTGLREKVEEKYQACSKTRKLDFNALNWDPDDCIKPYIYFRYLLDKEAVQLMEKAGGK